MATAILPVETWPPQAPACEDWLADAIAERLDALLTGYAVRTANRRVQDEINREAQTIAALARGEGMR